MENLNDINTVQDLLDANKKDDMPDVSDDMKTAVEYVKNVLDEKVDVSIYIVRGLLSALSKHYRDYAMNNHEDNPGHAALSLYESAQMDVALEIMKSVKAGD